MFFVMMMHLIHSFRWNLFLNNNISNFKFIYFGITNVTFMIEIVRIVIRECQKNCS